MWDTAPKNYVLYCVKYINKWDAEYLRRGVDQITEGGNTTTNIRHEVYIEDDEVCSVTTKDLHTITSGTEGFTAGGSGRFVIDGDKASWGNEEDRNVLYLDYNIDFGTKQYVTKDTLVVQTRGVAYEEFSTVYKE